MTRILMLYYSYTRQTRRVAEAMAATFRERGCDVEWGEIQFTDDRFDFNFPLAPFGRKMLKMIPYQLRGKTGTVEIAPQILDQEYDLVCVGSPTWWLFPAMPVTSLLRSEHASRLFASRPFAVFVVCRKFWSLNLRRVKKLAVAAGGNFLLGTKFQFRGGQVRSMLSFINYLKNGEDRQRYWGCKIYPFGVSDEGLGQAREFAGRLLDKLPSGSENQEA